MNASEAILYVGLAQSLFAAFALGTRKRISLPDKVLIACLLIFALKFLILVFHNQHEEFFDMQFSLGLIPLTFGPFLYLYTSYLVVDRPRFKAIDLMHFMPFVGVTVAYFMFFQDVVDFSDEQYLVQDEHLWVRVSFALLFFASVLTYTILTFVKLAGFRKTIDSQFSYRSGRLKLFWLNVIVVLFSLQSLAVILTGVVNAINFERTIDTSLISHVGLTGIAYIISYFGLRQPSLFTRRYQDYVLEHKPEAESKPEAKSENQKPEKPRFTEEQAAELIEKLQHHMLEERSYLNPELTLGELSAQINLAKHELTDLLNIHIGKNFFSYVNEFRLKAVIRRLENPDFDHLTIIAIANDCGFNSKSTFNSLFKQYTGHTPSEYKRHQRESAAQAEMN